MTHAEKARSALLSRGIVSKVVGIDPNLTKKGCSWGLTFDSREKQKAISVLKSKGIYFGEVVGG